MKNQKKLRKGKEKNRNSGITLIALIVTIIVLLILAGISIGMLSGDNGVLRQAGNAKTQNDIAQEKEILEQAAILAMDTSKYGNLKKEKLDKELEKYSQVDKTEEDLDGVLVTFKSNRKYLVNINGDIEQLKSENEDGFYIGDCKIADLVIPDWKNENREEFENRCYATYDTIYEFLHKCENNQDANYEQMLNFLNNNSIYKNQQLYKECIDWAYNNKGDNVKNLTIPSYDTEQTDANGWDVKVPINVDITSKKYNLYMGLHIDVQTHVEINKNINTGKEYFSFSNVGCASECTWIYWLDTSKTIPASVQLPLGMVLKHQDNPETDDELDWVIEWQGQTFNWITIRDFMINNLKFIHNGRTINFNINRNGGWNEQNNSDAWRKLHQLIGLDEETFRAFYGE